MSRSKKEVDPIIAEARRIRSTAAECHAIALFMAESAARKIIETVCLPIFVGDVWWQDISKPDDGDSRLVADCLRYIELRGDALPYRMLRKGKKLVRFVGNGARP